MNEQQKNKLLELINEYGTLKEKAGEGDFNRFIEYTNKSEKVFNKILDIIDEEDV